MLTLFATVQADRIERPDRSTLRGRLFAFGNWLIAASMLPAITLAVALAFQAHGRTAEFWAEGCIAAQILRSCWTHVARAFDVHRLAQDGKASHHQYRPPGLQALRSAAQQLLADYDS